MLILVNMKSSYEVLEVKKIIDSILLFSKTSSGRELLLNLKPCNSKNKLVLELNKLKEMIDIISAFSSLPIESSINFKMIISEIFKGRILEPIELNSVKNTLLSIKETINFLKKHKIISNYLKPTFDRLSFNSSLYELINSTITINNEIYDQASKELSTIRHDLNKLNKELKVILNRLLIKYKDKLNGDQITIKDNHYALPIQTSLKASVSGLILDMSDSGLTTFIEPSEIIEIENRISVLKLEERDEVSRILKSISDEIYSQKETLIYIDEAFGELDFIQSKALYTIDINGVIPTINEERSLHLINAYHPFIPKDECTPNTFNLDKDKTMMIISGPNAGGKTVALKTVGLLVYMSKLGIGIPCDNNSSLSFFNSIYIDVGDYQSIENNLSTFSGHISNLVEIFKYITSNDLVLLDEVGNGTDPEEGESLAIAIAKFLIKKQVISLLTSHFSALKEFGLSSPNVINASFLFDEKNIRPLFKMVEGNSGKSYGFLIAKKYGLNDEIISSAKDIYDHNLVISNKEIYKAIQEKEYSLSLKENLLKEKESAYLKKEEELNKKKEELKESIDKLKNKKIDEFDEYIDNMYDKVDDIYNEFIKTKKRQEAINKLDNLNKKDQSDDINVGDYVYIKSLNIKGLVTRKNQNKLSINTQDGFSLNANLNEVSKTEKPITPLKTNIDIDKEIINQKQVSSELNLIGYHIDEGLSTLDDYLASCLLKNFKNVKIIHGYGSGRLREAIHAHLKTNEHIKSFHLGSDLDGGTGSTIVTFK